MLFIVTFECGCEGRMMNYQTALFRQTLTREQKILHFCTRTLQPAPWYNSFITYFNGRNAVQQLHQSRMSNLIQGDSQRWAAPLNQPAVAIVKRLSKPRFYEGVAAVTSLTCIKVCPRSLCPALSFWLYSKKRNRIKLFIKLMVLTILTLLDFGSLKLAE